jgi:sugar phosphate isomerase/epimerase
MNGLLDRRSFLKAGAAGAAVCLSGLEVPCLAADAPKGTPNAAKLDWRVVCCTYTFRQFTFLEAAERAAGLGLTEMEAFAWQALSKDDPKAKADASLSADLRKDTKKRLDDIGVKWTGLYLGGAPSRRTFDFAKEMGIEILVAEPPVSVLEAVDKLCEEYKISVAIHNHPKPSSQYWDPQTVVEACKDRSKYMGCCGDTGHWCRSGVNPVEAVKALEGRMISFHLKDVVKFGGPSGDCPWGTGQGDIAGILKEVHRQKAKAVFGIEYEKGGDIMADLRQSIAYLEKVAGNLAG